METTSRTWIKALLWQALGFFMMTLVGMIFTGSAWLGGTLALVNTLVGFTAYVLYERIWNAVSWGRVAMTVAQK